MNAGEDQNNQNTLQNKDLNEYQGIENQSDRANSQDADQSEILNAHKDNESVNNGIDNNEELALRRSLCVFNKENNAQVYSVQIPKSCQSEPKCVAAKEDELLKLKDFQVY